MLCKTCRNVCGPNEECRTCATRNPPAHDPVNHPSHYCRGGIEVLDAIEAWGLNYRLGNVVKYVARAGHKGDRTEDLRKAAFYLNREIERGNHASNQDA